MARPMSRPQRWADAVNRARNALGEFDSAMQDLEDLQGEYQEWLDNLPEMAQGGALEDKLNEVIGLDIQRAEDSDLASMLEEFDAVDLPRGFGRD